MVSETLTGAILYSHMIPFVLGILSMLLICNGVMDNDKRQTIAGIILFFGAGLLPFVILRSILGV